MSEEIIDMKKAILSVLWDDVMGEEELKETLDSRCIEISEEGITHLLGELNDSGLIFSNGDGSSVTLLGSFYSLGMHDVCKSIEDRDEIFNFFKTRIPATIPKELLSKFKYNDNFKIIGEPDYADRMTYLLNEAIRTLPVAKKEIVVAVDTLFRPGFLYLIGVVRHRPKVKGLFSEDDFGREMSFIGMALKFINMELRVTGEVGQSLGAFIVDDKYCLFGFRTQKGVPGHDALLVTEDEECIRWVRENFEYAWTNFGRTP
ncbi:MAG: hypothetical protein SVJ22_04260 [Halobacteriota archaeon]|nr:hypothetical protein [Halobacteriota archaeon]MDY6959222.1 hypothetical protein [Halobacteriota archaeon]